MLGASLWDHDSRQLGHGPHRLVEGPADGSAREVALNLVAERADCRTARLARGRRVPLGEGQYMSAEYRAVCERLGVTQSAGRVATCFDNSAAESLWSSLKCELVHRYRFATKAEALAPVTAWIARM